MSKYKSKTKAKLTLFRLGRFVGSPAPGLQTSIPVIFLAQLVLFRVDQGVLAIQYSVGV